MFPACGKKWKNTGHASATGAAMAIRLMTRFVFVNRYYVQ
jgi:hypothetical protein